MRSALFILLLTNFGLVFSQSENFGDLELELVREFKIYESADYETRFDSLRHKLKKNVEKVLLHPNSFDHPFNLLSKRITIIKSSNDKVKIYSWDELTGGSWHDMAVIVQIKTNNHGVVVHWIDSDISEEDSIGIVDTIQREIYTVNMGEKTHYLCFGTGTHGAGHYHNSILLFSIENKTLKIFKNQVIDGYMIVQAPRRKPIDMHYNGELKEISYNEFTYNDSIGFFQPTGEKIKLSLIE